jgi:cellulose biosynthesis protein BcsQ
VKRIFFIHGDKGGVGKTEVAKRMAAVMLHAGRAVTLVDGDTKNPGLHFAFEHSGLDVQRIDVMTPAGRDALFDVIADSPGDVLIDLPARGSDVTERLSRDGASEDGFSLELLLAEIDAELTIISPSSSRASLSVSAPIRACTASASCRPKFTHPICDMKFALPRLIFRTLMKRLSALESVFDSTR